MVDLVDLVEPIVEAVVERAGEGLVAEESDDDEAITGLWYFSRGC